MNKGKAERLKEKYYCLFPSYHLGNGLVVCRMTGEALPEDNSIAFISPDREVSYTKGLTSHGKYPQYIEDYIYVLSLTDDRNISISQDQKVFNTRPDIDGDLRMKLHVIHERVKKAGYSGVLPNGNIVDRRIYPNAIPMQENSMFGIPKPRKL